MDIPKNKIAFSGLIRKQSLVLIGIRALCMILGYAGLFLVSKAVTDITYGLYVLLLTHVSFSYYLFNMGFDKTLTKYSARYKSNVILSKILLGFCTNLFTIISIITSIFIYILISVDLLPKYTLYTSSSVIIFFLSLLFFGINEFSYRWILGTGSVIQAEILHRLIHRLWFVSILIIVILYLTIIKEEWIDPLQLFFIYILGFIIPIGVAFYNKYLTVSEIKTFTLNIRLRKIWLARSQPFWFLGIFSGLTSNYDVIFIGIFIGVREAGIFGLISRLVTVQLFVLSSLNSAFSSKAAIFARDKNLHLMIHSFRENQALGFIFATIIFVIYLLFGSNILESFYSSFQEYWTVLVIVSIGCVFNSFVGPVGVLVEMADGEKVALKLAVLGLLLKIILSLSLYKALGLTGIAVSYTCSMVLTNLLFAIYVEKKYSVSILEIYSPSYILKRLKR